MLNFLDSIINVYGDKLCDEKLCDEKLCDEICDEKPYGEICCDVCHPIYIKRRSILQFQRVIQLNDCVSCFQLLLCVPQKVLTRMGYSFFEMFYVGYNLQCYFILIKI